MSVLIKGKDMPKERGKHDELLLQHNRHRNRYDTERSRGAREPENADALERKRGEWIEKQLDNFRKYSVTCPYCGVEYIDNYDGYVSTGDFNYCPNCGADMRKDGDV